MDAPFLVSDGFDAGYSRGDLRSRRWNSSVYGVRSRSSELTLAERCLAYSLRLPSAAFFSHLTAALQHSIPLPWAMAASTIIHVSVPAPHRAPHARGLRGHELAVFAGDIVVRNGVRMSSPARTWCDLAATLSLNNLVAAGDYLISRKLPIATVRELEACAAHFFGQRGMRRIREALPLLHDGSESPPESILRVIIVQGGLPMPRINHTLIDTETGRSLRPDFMFDREKVLLEYQGDYHRTKEQWRKDMTRRSRLEAAGWRVMELNWDDLGDPFELVARIRTLLFQSR